MEPGSSIDLMASRMAYFLPSWREKVETVECGGLVALDCRDDMPFYLKFKAKLLCDVNEIEC